MHRSWETRRYGFGGVVLCAAFVAVSGASARQSVESPTTAPATQPQRLLIPNIAAQSRARQLVREAFAKDLERARMIGADSFGTVLIAQAEKAKDSVERYVLLTDARDLTSPRRYFTVAFRAIDELNRSFEIDRLRMKMEALRQGADFRGVIDATAVARSVTPAAFVLVDEAVAADDYATALSALALAKWTCQTSKWTHSTPQLNELNADVQRMQEEFKRAEAARARLKEQADDAGANLLVGRFVCFSKGQFEAGLPMLAKGSDSELRGLAQRSLATPGSAAEQVALANDWWAYGEKNAGFVKRNARRYATGWYQKALPQLTGLEKSVVEKRINDAATGR